MSLAKLRVSVPRGRMPSNPSLHSTCYSGLRPLPQAGELNRFHASRQFVPTRFGRIAYVERGSGPAALFLHGLPLNGFQWRGSLERLSAHRRCLVPDLIGLGYTEAPDQQTCRLRRRQTCSWRSSMAS
jgi:hypothetical protein